MLNGGFNINQGFFNSFKHDLKIFIGVSMGDIPMVVWADQNSVSD